MTRVSGRWNRPWIRSVVLGSGVVLLTLHVGIAGLILATLPRGFPLDDIHTIAHLVLPITAGLFFVVALIQFVFFRASALLLSLGTAMVAGAWLGAASAASLLFPVSFGIERAIGPATVALGLGCLAWALRLRPLASMAFAWAGIAVGVVEVLALKSPPPSTRPSGGTLAEVHGDPIKDDAATGQVSFPCGKDHIRVRPLLTFESRSPDATLIAFAPSDAFGRKRRFNAFIKEKDGFRAHYTDDGETTFIATKDAKGLAIEAVTRLDTPVYAHVSAFTAIHVPFRASVLLGPFEKPIDLDEGALSFAYLASDQTIRFVRFDPEASGSPYREIGSGRLAREDPLPIELRRADGTGGVCRLTFKDWGVQASTELSPSAGWGIPQNAIQLFRKGNETVVILTLAGTAIGRGTASVGHAAGTYKNRIRVDTAMTLNTSNPPVPPPPPKKK